MRRTLTAVALVLGLTGCGPAASPAAPDDAKPAKAAAVDACDLLTNDEASALLGKPAGDPERGINAVGADQTDCDWQNEDDFALSLIQLYVFSSDTYLPRDAYKAGEVIGDVQVDGAQPGAFATTSGKTTVGVNFVANGHRVTLDVTRRDDDRNARLAALRKAGAQIAGRLR